MTEETKDYLVLAFADGGRDVQKERHDAQHRVAVGLIDDVGAQVSGGISKPELSAEQERTVLDRVVVRLSVRPGL